MLVVCGNRGDTIPRMDAFGRSAIRDCSSFCRMRVMRALVSVSSAIAMETEAANAAARIGDSVPGRSPNCWNPPK